MTSAAVDPANLAGVFGVGGIVLVLAFRAFFQVNDSWKAVVEAAQKAESAAWVAAKVANAAAAAAQEDAHQARKEARTARTSESECQRRLNNFEARLTALEDDGRQ